MEEVEKITKNRNVDTELLVDRVQIALFEYFQKVKAVELKG